MKVGWSVLAVSAGVLAMGEPARAASQQELFLELIHALQRASETRAPHQASAMPAEPSVTSGAPEVFTPDLSLLGVIIAEPTRLALIQRAAGSELFALGASLGNYRLTAIEEEQVTLESQSGLRVVLRLPAGGGAGGAVAPPAPTDRVEAPKPGAGAPSWAELVREKEERSARQKQRDVEDKARSLREHAVSAPETH